MFLWRLNTGRAYIEPIKKLALYQYKTRELTMSRTDTARIPLRPSSSLFLRIRRVLATVLARRRDRQQLGHLDPRLLRDIGLDEVTAAKECAKPIWRP